MKVTHTHIVHTCTVRNFSGGGSLSGDRCDGSFSEDGRNGSWPLLQVEVVASTSFSGSGVGVDAFEGVSSFLHFPLKTISLHITPHNTVHIPGS